MFAQGVSYSSKFSTVLLAGRAAELSVPVQEADLNASDPLPTYLGNATVRFNRAGMTGFRASRLYGQNNERGEQGEQREGTRQEEVSRIQSADSRSDLLRSSL